MSPQDIPHQLDERAGACRAVIETPRGSRAKYSFDADLGVYRLKTLLPAGMSFPADFGFVPSTCAPDGDPLDVMVLFDEPAAVGALLDVRLIGMMEAAETDEGRQVRNDRLLAVAAVSPRYGAVRSLEDLPAGWIDDLVAFWDQKGRLEGKGFEVLHLRGPAAAIDAVRRASQGA